ncbi:COX15/CtaA family protein [Silvibacterium dinghuense]|uniref:Cytochrome oxidase assembly protein n=1 Tax=Silvibacterium dinghuense TaxID=1560006 RepID=A0A4V1NUS9_9BACT|nr:COX15/CtaA family protein [Silvibacterium dinghuense]RXS93298.1 cytochrome oxidase assembly protein [Silvibacterium dinghuense]GGH04686.1 cytochrome oxidase assembly protein [Silvibacterium dinghuense]
MNAVSVPAPATSAPAQQPTRALRRFAWGVVAYNVLVVIDGVAVRATGSGAGCGDHWPLCNGSVVQHHPTVATMIEFAHRSMSGVALIAIIGLVWWTFRTTAKWHLARAAAIAALVLTLNEALLGALLVLLGKVATDQSASRGVYLALHLTNTLLMVAALTLTAHFLSRQRGYMRGSVELRSKGLIFTGLFTILVTGVFGSLAALADTLYPSPTLRAAILEDFATDAPTLLHLRWLHPVISLVAGVFILWMVLRAFRSPAHRGLGFGVIGLLLLQYWIGFADLALLAPVALQMLHLLGADLLWIALIVLTARLYLRPIGCTDGLCS